jgi:hypothetical protein
MAETFETTETSLQPPTPVKPKVGRRVGRKCNYPFTRRLIDDKRWAKFLEIVRETGLPRYAAKVASPHLRSAHERYPASAGWGSFKQHMQDHPDRRIEYEAALDEGIAVLEKLARERCTVPDSRPILDRLGQIVGHDLRWDASNRMILRTLAHADPAWSDRREVNVSGKVEHTLSLKDQQNSFPVFTADIARLSAENVENFFALLDKMQALKDDAEQNEKTKALPDGNDTDTDADVLDGEVVGSATDTTTTDTVGSATDTVGSATDTVGSATDTQSHDEGPPL